MNDVYANAMFEPKKIYQRKLSLIQYSKIYLQSIRTHTTVFLLFTYENVFDGFFYFILFASDHIPHKIKFHS